VAIDHYGPIVDLSRSSLERIRDLRGGLRMREAHRLKRLESGELADTGLDAIPVEELFEVDLATGDRTVLIAPDPPAGPGPQVMHGLALVPGPPGAAPRLLLTDRDFGALLAVDLTPDPLTGVPSGARVIVSR